MPTMTPIAPTSYTASERSLHARTQALVTHRPHSLTLQTIAQACDVSLHWLERFAAGAFKEPGVNKVERVFKYLTNYKPEA